MPIAFAAVAHNTGARPASSTAEGSAREEHAGRAEWSARLSDVALPAGFEDVAAASRASAGREAAVGAWLTTRIEVRVDAAAEVAGRGELHLGFVPCESP